MKITNKTVSNNGLKSINDFEFNKAYMFSTHANIYILTLDCEGTKYIINLNSNTTIPLHIIHPDACNSKEYIEVQIEIKVTNL